MTGWNLVQLQFVSCSRKQSTQNWGYNPQPQQQFNPYTNQPTNQGIYSNTNTNINTNANSNTAYNPYNNIQMSTNQTNQTNQTKVNIYY